MVFLDANILLELCVPERPQKDAVELQLRQLETTTAVSVLSIHLLYYFGRKFGVADDKLEAVVGSHRLLPLAAEDYQWAKQHEKGKDFEDALQLAAAIRGGCERFITLDQALRKNYAHLPNIKIEIPD